MSPGTKGTSLAEAGTERTHSYRLEDLDAAAELKRLEAQVALLAPLEFSILREIGVGGAQVVADVGAGPGFFAERLAAELDGGRVIGVEIDAAMVEVATERTKGSSLPLEFRLGTAQRMPLADDAVDVAYARFLFQHLADPRPVLAEMQRIVKPGGLVVVGDTDDGGLVLHPAPDGFDAFLAASGRAQAARGGDRRVGRKLKAYLAESGLADVRATTRALTSEDIGPEALIAIAVGFKAGVLKPPWVTEDELTRMKAELALLGGADGFYGHALGTLAWGRVPAAS